MRIRLEDVCFLHWPVPASVLRPLVPEGLEIDTFEDNAWLSLVALRMKSLGWTIVQLNTRTYVKDRAVYFLRLDGSSRIAAFVSRHIFSLPYWRSAITLEAGRFHCRQTDGGELKLNYRGTGEPARAEAGSLDHWLVERYVSRGHGDHQSFNHEPWTLQPAVVEIETNTVTPIPLGAPAKAHYVREIRGRF